MKSQLEKAQTICKSEFESNMSNQIEKSPVRNIKINDDSVGKPF